MKKRFLSLLCAAVLICSLSLPAFAATGEQALAADTLYTLGLMQGTDDGYQLDRAPTRLEALITTIRLSGHEAEALAAKVDHPFTDVPKWAEHYVSWAWANGLTKGVSATRFGVWDPANAAMCATMVLRTLGYSESDSDFSYKTAALLACRLGLMDSSAPASFHRGDLFDLCLRALSARVDGTETTLLNQLIDMGAVEAAKANALGLAPRSRLTARQVADRYSSAVFYMESYETMTDKLAGTHTSNASGFFISADGLAITNQHAITKTIHSVITTISGEKYPIESVLFADKELDIALIRVSRTSLDGQENATFPYLTIQRSDTVHNGDVVYALGSPLGLQNSISSGIVSNRERELEGFSLPIIQNSAPISEGSSGGPLLNEYGEAIGITSAYFIYGQSMYIAVRLDPVFELDKNAEGMTLAEYHTILLAEEANSAATE